MSSAPTSYAFILALGRSGTQLLARMLQGLPSSAVHHEPWPEDAHLMNLRYAGFNRIAEAMLEDRFARLAEQSGHVALHLEANSYLRYEAAWLRERLGAKLVHLVRDGRTFIQSAYVRDVYTPWDIQLPIVPRDGDPLAGEWTRLSRFEKLCWYWDHSNRQLADAVPDLVRMEDLLRSYEAFRDGVLLPLGIHLDEDGWRREVARPANTKSRYLFRKALKRWLSPGPRRPRPEALAHWSRWTSGQRERFEAMCGDTMRRLGYPMNWEMPAHG